MKDGGYYDTGNGGGLDSLWFQLVTYSAVASEVLLFFFAREAVLVSIS